MQIKVRHGFCGGWECEPEEFIFDVPDGASREEIQSLVEQEAIKHVRIEWAPWPPPLQHVHVAVRQERLLTDAAPIADVCGGGIMDSSHTDCRFDFVNKTTGLRLGEHKTKHALRYYCNDEVCENEDFLTANICPVIRSDGVIGFHNLKPWYDEPDLTLLCSEEWDIIFMHPNYRSEHAEESTEATST